jgi:hypothetical protein
LFAAWLHGYHPRDRTASQKDAMPDHTSQSALTLVLGLVLAAALLLFWKTLFRVVRRLVMPLVKRLSFLRLTSKVSSKSKSALAVGSIVALTAGTINRAALGGNETDQAILDNFEPKGITRHPQMFCSWLTAEPENTPYDNEQAKLDEIKAKQFFSTEVPIESDPLNFYEDIEGAFVVGLFKDSDKPCFYVLSEYRKIINGNVLRLTVLFSLIVSLVAIANLVWTPSIYSFFHLADFISPPATLHLFDMSFDTEPFVNKFIFGIVSCLIGYVLLFVIYNMQYARYQGNNGQQMNKYLIDYLSGINITFQKITANAAQLLLDEPDAETMKKETETLITNLQWVAFRVLFIELFLRNVLFQIRRNSSFYVLVVPIFFVLVLLFTAHEFAIEEFNIFDLRSNLYHLNSFYIAFPLLLVACYGYLKDSLSVISEFIGQRRWSKFYQLKLHETMTKTLDGYVNQIIRWRGVNKPDAPLTRR